MTDLKIEQRQRARHVADELNEALCKRDIGRAEAVLFVNRIVIHEALEAFASPPPQEGIEDRARARELWARCMEQSDGLAKGSCAADIRSGALDDSPAMTAILAALRGTDSVAGAEVEAREEFTAGWEACDRKWEGPSAAGYPEDVDEAWELHDMGRPAYRQTSGGVDLCGEVDVTEAVAHWLAWNKYGIAWAHCERASHADLRTEAANVLDAALSPAPIEAEKVEGDR